MTIRAISSPRFADRRDAGRQLARELVELAELDPIVIALPRGGVPVAYEVARALDAPLDILLVRKLGAPMQPELGIGAIAEGAGPIVDAETVRRLDVTETELAAIVDRERVELERRRHAYRNGREPLDVAGHVVILVDDGIATGVTAVAGARALRRRGARAVILAAPVGPADAERRLGGEFDSIVCPTTLRYGSVGAAYRDFGQTSDAEVRELLSDDDSDVRLAPPDEGEVAEHEVTIDADVVGLTGTLRVPSGARGLVVFAHGSGSSRMSPRNRAVAERLNAAGLATLLLDLLTPAEAADRRHVFDIELLAARVLAGCRWARRQQSLARLPVGLFGASTGGAAALQAAAAEPDLLDAVVSRGGRPDLAGTALPAVTAPTLLIVGGDDQTVLALNEAAAEKMNCEHEVVVVPGAGHLFEEPGALELVAQLAAHWFAERLEGPITAGGRPATA